MSEFKDLLQSKVFTENAEQEILKPFSFQEGYKNELIFFFKPETFLLPAQVSERVIEMIESKLEEYGANVSGIVAVRGPVLERHGIMDRHYGFINTLSKNASKMVSLEELEPVAEAIGLDLQAEKPQILGGHEFLEQFPEFNAESLNDLWFQERSARVRSGFYVRRVNVNGKDVVLVNGFHPLQLEHYTNPEHKTVVALLHSNTPWKVLREEMIGDTYPDKASPNSVRGTLYADDEVNKWVEVSIANNFVHLSAGPFEALKEMENFLKPLIGEFSLAKTNVGRAIIASGLDESAISYALTNPTVKTAEGETDLFSATELADTDEAVALFVENVKASKA